MQIQSSHVAAYRNVLARAAADVARTYAPRSQRATMYNNLAVKHAKAAIMESRKSEAFIKV